MERIATKLFEGRKTKVEQFLPLCPGDIECLYRWVIAPEPWNAELLAHDFHPRQISHVIFDFDGTLSWLRSGWPDVMAQLFSEYLPNELKNSVNVRNELRRDILALNGKPSIYQIRYFHDRGAELNAMLPAPEELLELYLARLNDILGHRIDSLTGGDVLPGNFVIAGARTLLDELRVRQRRLIILSGTATPDVRREAELLGLTPFFRENIYGSTPGEEFSKKEVIDRVMREDGIEGEHLLSFGDGPVEIEFTKAVGGLGIGVASDERTNGSGIIDAQKRAHLVNAGADAIIPDFRNTRWILEKFFE